MSTTQTPAMQRLVKVGKKLARVNAQREAVIEELRAAIREADAEGGHTRSQLVQAAGVARQTVYDALTPAPAPQASPGAVADGQAAGSPS